MEEENKKSLNEGQEAVVGVMGFLANVGAGGLVGGLCLAAAATMEMSKPLKAIYYIGSVGIGWAAGRAAGNATEDVITKLFDVANGLEEKLKKLQEKKNAQQQVEGVVV